MRAIPIELMKETYEYNSETGELIHKLPTHGRRKQGCTAGWLTPKGYREVRLKGCNYRAHRVAWAIYYGEDPGDLEVDHINHDRDDNRISNLRLVTRSENRENQRSMGVLLPA